MHDIDTGDLLGDGVLYLNTGVDLDEVEFAVGRSQKFYGTGADVVNILHQFHSGIANSLALLQRQGEGRGDFHQLLVTTLYGAITLEKMHQITVHIANDLHLDMLGVLQIFFQIDFVIAKGLLCFAFGQIIGSDGFLGGVHDTHAATTAAVDGLDDDGIAIAFAKVQHLLQRVDGALAAGDHGDAGQLSLLTGVDFIAEHNEMLQTGTDKGNALLLAATC